MNKSMKILSLVLLVSASFAHADEAAIVEETTAITKTVVEKHDAAETTKSTMDKVKEVAQHAVDKAGEKFQVTEDSITKFFDNLDETVTDKTAYIKNNFSSFVASLSKKTEKVEEEVKTA